MGQLDSYMQRLKLDYFLKAYSKKDKRQKKNPQNGLNVRSETLKLLEENIGSML